jgi:biopolymer transport protein ExbD
MKAKYYVSPVAPQVPTASMADIAFLLIIFFMLTTSFSPERTSVELPNSQIRTEVSKNAAIVAITQDGILKFTDGEQPSFTLSESELGQLTSEIIGLIPGKEFVIKADRSARYEHIDKVLEQLRVNGAKKIGLLTDRRVGEII